MFHWHNFSGRYGLGVASFANRNEYRDYSLGGLRRLVSKADILTTFLSRFSRTLRTSTSWNPLGLSRPVQGFFYLLLFICLESESVQRFSIWGGGDFGLVRGVQTGCGFAQATCPMVLSTEVKLATVYLHGFSVIKQRNRRFCLSHFLVLSQVILNLLWTMFLYEVTIRATW
jgi:hypothetical protein